VGIILSVLLFALTVPFVLTILVACSNNPRAFDIGAESYRLAESTLPDPPDNEFAARTADLERTVRELACAMASRARANRVRLEFAVGTGLKVRLDQATLVTALREIVLTSIHAAPGGNVLITAATLGSQVHIRVTDDGEGADQPMREALTHGAETSIALQGGSTSVEARRGQYTTVTLRIPVAAARSSSSPDIDTLVSPRELAIT
jgi:hypothetical protein